MHIIFCADPLAPRAVDTAYTDEAQAAMDSGLEYDLISYEQLVHEHDAAAAVRRVPAAAASSELALYRGWMLRPSEYHELYDALLARELLLINNPAAYRTCHYLPESYPLISDATPASAWLPLDACGDLDAIMRLLTPFGDQPVIVKDYV